MYDTISMIGLGYIGLPTATLFASRRKHVIGVDVSKHAVDTINSGRIHIVEPELDILVHAVVKEGFLRASLTPEPADAFLIAVPTPFHDGYKADLSYVQSASEAIAPVLKKGDLVVLESTSPVGTTEKVAEWLAAARPDLSFPQQDGDAADVQVAYCPERVLPGRVVHELVSNDRVIGGMTKRSAEMAVELYKIFVEGECIITNARTAEMCKLTENSFRDVNIAFANELSIICDKLNINVWELIALANHHPRVKILQPGAGVGGHCIAVDPWFIVETAPEEARIIRTAREVNDGKPHWVLKKIKAASSQAVQLGQRPKIACLGLSFKPDIDDLRESPALDIAQHLARTESDLLVVEPHIKMLPEVLNHSNVRLTTLSTAVEQADVICVLVKHSEFSEIVSTLQNHRFVIDAVGLSD